MSSSILQKVIYPATDENPFEIPFILDLVRLVWRPFYIEFDRVMNLQSAEARAAYLWWWLVRGLKNYPFPDSFLSEKNWNSLHQVIGVRDGHIGWTWLAEGAYYFEHSLSPDLIFPNPSLRNSIESLRWFFCYAVPFRDASWLLPEDVIKFLNDPHEEFDGKPFPLSRIQKMFHEFASEKVARFDIQTVQGRKDYLLWLGGEGRSVSGLDVYKFVKSPLRNLSKPTGSLGGGINILGHADSISGVGEDIRMATLSFESVGVQSQAIHYMKPIEDNQLLFPVNLFCVSGFQILLSLGMHREQLFSGRYNIGYFPWELEDWPDALVPALEICDELWTSSKFIFDSVKKKTSRPVKLMPMAVEVPHEIWSYLESKPARKQSEPVRFIFMFDLQSGLQRKNANACLLSFEQAFRADENVSLTIKVINPQGDQSGFLNLKQASKADPRIKIIDETLPRLEVLKLIADHDAFVSLHRAEGFGRGIAEALLLGKHVVTTNYSGNVDFCKPDFTFLVDYDLVPVQAQEYVFSKDQVWADVRISSAVEQLRKCYEKVQSGVARNIEGQSYISANFSKTAVGLRYLSRLQELKLI